MVKWAKAKSRKETQYSKGLESRTRETTNGMLELPKENKRTRSLGTIKSVQLTPFNSMNP